MGKRQDESSKGSGVRATKAKTAATKTARAKTAKAKTTRAAAAKEQSPSEVIMTMTLEEAKIFLANFKAVRSRGARGRNEE